MKQLLLLFLLSFGAKAAFSQDNKAHINHVAVFVVSLQKSVDFYTNVMGLDTIPEPFHDNKHAWYRIGPGAALHVIEGAKEPKEYFLNNHMCFSVASVDGFVEKLKKHQIGWVNAKGEKMLVTTRVDGVKQIWINDPDGYWLEINDAKD
ncbi:VOC family protein [Sediminibacterium soli]|uniref:VOC family protein n=1 Tax=Sediminibacterium soli TaxID=2698829 RepID=UPI00137A3749|nr:VOC family protein [Sediminibacterium soli]NCI45265.1 VOC family protein [Sediminibacterium soli]